MKRLVVTTGVLLALTVVTPASAAEKPPMPTYPKYHKCAHLEVTKKRLNLTGANYTATHVYPMYSRVERKGATGPITWYAFCYKIWPKGAKVK